VLVFDAFSDHLHKGGGREKGRDKSTERGSVHDEK